MNKRFYASDRDGLWTVIRNLRRFSLSDLEARSYMDQSSIRTYLRILVKGGYLEVAKASGGKPTLYNLIKDNGTHRPDLSLTGAKKGPNGRQRMWMSMKALGRFCYRDLSLAAMVSAIDAKDYCHALKHAQYLRVVEPAVSRISPEVYIFVKKMDTGIWAPVTKKTGELYDRNLRQIVWSPVKQEAVA